MKPLVVRIRRVARNDLMICVARGASEIYLDTVPDGTGARSYADDLARQLGRGRAVPVEEAGLTRSTR